jgi:hypothetical protein
MSMHAGGRRQLALDAFALAGTPPIAMRAITGASTHSFGARRLNPRPARRSSTQGAVAILVAHPARTKGLGTLEDPKLQEPREAIAGLP